MKAHEVRLGDHHQIPTSSKMGPIFEFFGENIAGVDGAWDVEDVDIDIDDGFVDLAFAQIDVFHSFFCQGGGPGDACFIAVLDCNLVEGVIHDKVLGTVFDMKRLLGAFVDGKDFSFAGALGGLVLSDGVTGDGTAAATDKVTGE